MSEQQTFDWRGTDPDTSRLAALYSLPNRSAHQIAVLNALRAMGERGGTDFEIEAATGIKQTSSGKRRLDLVRSGHVVPRMVIDPRTLELRQDRRLAPSGTPSLVWVAQEYERSDARREANQ